MSEFGSVCGSAESRAKRHGAHMWALGSTLSWLCACSGSTDVIGVVESNVTDVQLTTPSSGATTPSPSALGGAGTPQSSSDGSELLVVAGLPIHDYPGPIFEWPLGVRLRTFFSETVWPGHSGPPDHVERDAFDRMGAYSDQHHDDVRFIASTGDVAERLRDLFSAATLLLRTEPRSVVTRDAWFDEYMVVLGTASCTDSSSHHGDPCADPDPSAAVDFTGSNSSGANLGAP